MLSERDYQRDWIEWQCSADSRESYSPDEDMLDDEWAFEFEPEYEVIDGDMINADSNSDAFEFSF